MLYPETMIKVYKHVFYRYLRDVFLASSNHQQYFFREKKKKVPSLIHFEDVTK